VAQWVGREGLKAGDVAVLVAKTPKGYAYDILSSAAKNSAIKFAFSDHDASGCVVVDTYVKVTW
jgi:hypothetical protein